MTCIYNSCWLNNSLFYAGVALTLPATLGRKHLQALSVFDLFLLSVRAIKRLLSLLRGLLSADNLTMDVASHPFVHIKLVIFAHLLAREKERSKKPWTLTESLV
jgi:hypothetical protein